MTDIRAVVYSSIESLRGQNVRVDADVAAALKRCAYDPLTSLLECLGKLVARPRVSYVNADLVPRTIESKTATRRP